jgi:sulfatase maturation enzyme AslB (radical SAM superfamily)
LDECPELSIHFNFSFDGLGKTHDRIRGMRGNFKKTIASMELIKQKYGGNTRLLQNVATVVTPDALHEMFDLGVYLLRKDLVSTRFFEVVNMVGLGPHPIIPKKVKTSDLVKALECFTKGTFHKNVMTLSDKMKNEDGIKRSVDIIIDKINSL